MAWQRVLDTFEFSSEQTDFINGVYEWFNEQLHVPQLGPHDWRAVFWFWSSSGQFIERMWSLAWGLKSLDVPVEMVKCRQPGRIVYADEYQVAAVPHRIGLSKRLL